MYWRIMLKNQAFILCFLLLAIMLELWVGYYYAPLTGYYSTLICNNT